MLCRLVPPPLLGIGDLLVRPPMRFDVDAEVANEAEDDVALNFGSDPPKLAHDTALGGPSGTSLEGSSLDTSITLQVTCSEGFLDTTLYLSRSHNCTQRRVPLPLI